MKVDIKFDDEAQPAVLGADLQECFPDDLEEYTCALRELAGTGSYHGGGGAAPAFTLTLARETLTRGRIERLDDERNELMNSFGGSSHGDGLIRQRIEYIDAMLSGEGAP